MNKETLCVDCVHKNVCKYREEYNRLKNEIKNVRENTPSQFDVKAVCLHYIEQVSNPRGGSNVGFNT